MARKQVSKVSDKLTKVDESFTVYMHDNGYMLEISGRAGDDEWCNAKIQVGSVDKLVELINEVSQMERS